DVGRPLDVGQLLAGLLHAGVEVADDRLGPQHRLALEFEHDPEHAVRRRVLRPEVDDHGLVGLRPRLRAHDEIARGERHRGAWASLNWTGTRAGASSLRSGWPSQSSGSSRRTRSGWPAKRTPKRS